MKKFSFLSQTFSCGKSLVGDLTKFFFQILHFLVWSPDDCLSLMHKLLSLKIFINEWITHLLYKIHIPFFIINKKLMSIRTSSGKNLHVCFKCLSLLRYSYSLFLFFPYHRSLPPQWSSHSISHTDEKRQGEQIWNFHCMFFLKRQVKVVPPLWCSDYKFYVSLLGC